METLIVYEEDFIKTKEILNTVGFELIGTKSIDNDTVYFLVKKKKNH